jgi:hypothetical protein
MSGTVQASVNGAAMRFSSPLSTALAVSSLSWMLAGCAWQVRPSPEAVKPVAAGHAAPAAPGATLLAANGQPDPNTVICHREEVTGSRLEGPKECHTRAEWVAIKDAGHDKLQMQSAGSLPETDAAVPGGR